MITPNRCAGEMHINRRVLHDCPLRLSWFRDGIKTMYRSKQSRTNGGNRCALTAKTSNRINLHCNNAKAVFILIGKLKRKLTANPDGEKKAQAKIWFENAVTQKYPPNVSNECRHTNAVHSNYLLQNYAISINMMISQSYYWQIDFFLSVFGLCECMRVWFCTFREEEISAAVSQLMTLNNRNRID